MTGEAVTSESTGSALARLGHEEAVSGEDKRRCRFGVLESPALEGRRRSRNCARAHLSSRTKRAVVTVPATPPAEYSALTPQLRGVATGPLDILAGAAR